MTGTDFGYALAALLLAAVTAAQVYRAALAARFPDVYHVYPTFGRAHRTRLSRDGSCRCWCGPRVEVAGGPPGGPTDWHQTDRVRPGDRAVVVHKLARDESDG